MVGNSSSWTFMLQQLNDASMSSCVWPTIKKYTNPSLKMPLAQTTNCMWRAGGKVLQGWGVQGVPTMKTYKPLYPLASPHKRVSFHHHHIGTWGLWRTPLGTLGTFKTPHKCPHTTRWTINPSSCKHSFFIHWNFIYKECFSGCPRSFIDHRMGHYEWMACMWSDHETTPSIHNASVAWLGKHNGGGVTTPLRTIPKSFIYLRPRRCHVICKNCFMSIGDQQYHIVRNIPQNIVSPTKHYYGSK